MTVFQIAEVAVRLVTHIPQHPVSNRPFTGTARDWNYDRAFGSVRAVLQ